MGINYVVHQITIVEMSMGTSERSILQEFFGVKFAQEFRTTLLNWRAINSGSKWKFIENLGPKVLSTLQECKCTDLKICLNMLLL